MPWTTSIWSTTRTLTTSDSSCRKTLMSSLGITEATLARKSRHAVVAVIRTQRTFVRMLKLCCVSVRTNLDLKVRSGSMEGHWAGWHPRIWASSWIWSLWTGLSAICTKWPITSSTDTSQYCYSRLGVVSVAGTLIMMSDLSSRDLKMMRRDNNRRDPRWGCTT